MSDWSTKAAVDRSDRADLEDYPEVRASRGSDSVRDFDRWQAYWSDGMSLEVLNRDGSVAEVDTALSNVRRTYRPSPASDHPESNADLLRYYLDNSGGIDLALREYMIEVLQRQGVSAPNEQDFRRVPGLGYSKSVQFQFVTEDDAQMEADSVIGCPDELPKRFWARFGMVIRPCVMVICSESCFSSVDFGVLTDGQRDWWYAFANTNYYLGYETGESTPATVDERRARLLNFSNQVGGFITVPDHLTTSLIADDLKWLRGVQDYRSSTSRGACAGCRWMQVLGRF